MWHRVDRDVPGAHQLGRRGQGPTPARLLFSGHQNGLADPVLACVTLSPQLHFFTRSDVFRRRAARWFLLRLNMMPIFRPIDRAKDMAERNKATFHAAQTRLESGATCGIFPEAGHLDERRIRRFRHGSARFISGALQRPGVRKRGLEIIPLHLDFERYAGYRTRARLSLGHPVRHDDIEGLSLDTGPARIQLSERMRQALIDTAVHLEDGDLYDAHLGVLRYMEGHFGGRVEPELIRRCGARLREAESDVLQDFRALMDGGMGHPRTSDELAAAGRIGAGRPTRMGPVAWRWPAWVVFRITTQWWAPIIEAAAERRVKAVAFRTTFSMPANMVAVCLTWGTLSALVGWVQGQGVAVPVTLLLLRVCQGMALPFEDALIDRRSERRARPHAEAAFLSNWCRPAVLEAEVR